MRSFIYSLGVYAILLLVIGCQPVAVQKQPPEKQALKKPEIPDLPDSVLMQNEGENVRQSPNGRILGQLYMDERIFIDGRVGNWLLFHNEWFDSAYVWAPSAGMECINLYSPITYYDTTTRQFYPVEYIQDLLGVEGRAMNETAHEYQLVFSGLGLGSHQTVVMGVGERHSEMVKHNITLFIDKSGQKIFRVGVDFFQPVEGVKSALEKCDLTYTPPSEVNEGHVIWWNGNLVPGLVIDLERKNWKSELLRRVSFTTQNSDNRNEK